MPQNQRPTTLDGASAGYLANIGASTFGSDYVNTGQIPPSEEVRAFAYDVLSEGFNLGDGLNDAVDALTRQILVSILNEDYVDVSELQSIQSDPLVTPDNGVRLPYEVDPTVQVPLVGPLGEDPTFTITAGGELRYETPAEAAERGAFNPLDTSRGEGLVGALSTPNTRDVVEPRIQNLPIASNSLAGIRDPQSITRILGEQETAVTNLLNEVSRSMIPQMTQLRGGGDREVMVQNANAFSSLDYAAGGSQGVEARQQNSQAATYIATQLGFPSAEEMAEYAKTYYDINFYRPIEVRAGFGRRGELVTMIVPSDLKEFLFKVSGDFRQLRNERNR